MRILHIPHTYAPSIGGTEYLSGRLNAQLKEYGHEILVLVPDTPTPHAMGQLGHRPNPPLPSKVEGIDVLQIPLCGTWQYRLFSKLIPPLHILPWKRPYWYLFYTSVRKIGEVYSSRFVQKAMAQFEPDVVVAMAHLFPNTKWVLKIHRQDPFPLVHIPLVHHDDYENMVNQAQSLQQASATITLTKSEASFLQERCNIPLHQLFVGGVGTEIPETLPLKEGDPFVLLLGRREPYKGIPETIEAMRHVWKHKPNLRLVLAGPRTVTSHLVDSILDRLPAKEKANVILLDKVTPEEKSRLLRNALCLVFASKSESFGLVLIEAMAHGTPPITWDVPLFRETVLHGKTGLLAESNNSASLGEAILTLAQNPSHALTLGANGRERVKLHYRWEVVAKNYLRAYEFAQQQGKSEL
jgi:glycosyltransferase involved in cell wall biosynthesis